MEEKLAESEAIDKSQLADHFDNVQLSLQKLQKFISASTMFLPSYEIRTSLESFHDLEARIKNKRDTLLPKKKFAFKGKKKSALFVDSNKEMADVIDGSLKKVSTEMPQEIACGFKNHVGEILEMQNNEICDKDVILSKLKECTVKICGVPSTVHMDNLQNCKVFIGPVSTSIFIDNCSGSTFIVACQQLRVHTTSDCSFYLHVTSRGIIEDCTKLKFAPFKWSYHGIDEHYRHAGLNREINNWDDIGDFNWLASNKKSPNWCILDLASRVEVWDA